MGVRAVSFPPVEEHLVEAGKSAEIVCGRLVFLGQASEAEGIAHARLAYVLRAHAVLGFDVALNLLTRVGVASDFCTQACVVEIAPRRRKLEELAFLIAHRQPLPIQTKKARELTHRGVRRVFLLDARNESLAEWSATADTWYTYACLCIDDPCFARPLPTSALWNDAAADAAVVHALLTRAGDRPAD